MISLSLFLRRSAAGFVLVLLGLGAARLAADVPLPTPMAEDLFPELKSIMQQALAQSPQMILRNIEIAQNDGNYVQVRSILLPSIGTGASYNVSGAAVSSNSSVSSTSSGLYYSLSIGQPIFRWGTLKAQKDAAKIQLDIARKDYAEGYRTLALTLRSQYLALITKKQAKANAQFSQRQAAAFLALEEDKLRNGQASGSQVTLLRLQAEESALAAERAAEELAVSKRYFLRQAGLTELSDESIPAEIPAVNFDPADSQALLRRFLAHEWEDNTTLQIARSQVKIAALNYKVAQYRLFPMFSLAASVSQSNSTQASLNSVSQVSVLSEYYGVSMSWSVFDGFATRGAKIGARANQRFYDRQLQTQTDQLLDQAMSLERQVSFAYRALKLAQIRTELSAAALNAMQEDAKTGLISRAAFEAATGAHNQTRLQMLNQRADFLSRWAEFVSTLGHDPVLAQLSIPTHAS